MKRFISAAAVAVTLIGGGAWYFTQGTGPAQTSFALPGAAVAQSSGEVDISGIVEMVQGNPDATVEVVEYASYTCPHCANFHSSVYKDLKKDYIDTGKIKFVYREVYFDKYGMWGSMIARCGGPEKFFGITDLIYKGQREWTRAGSEAAIADELRKIGLLAGIGKDELDSCLSDGDKLRALVTWYQQNAQADDITSTPSFLINGQKYSNMNYADFSATLDEKLGE